MHRSHPLPYIHAPLCSSASALVFELKGTSFIQMSHATCSFCVLCSLQCVFVCVLAFLSHDGNVKICRFAVCVKPGGDNVYGHNDYYADAFRKPR